jgi:hypothetical protein
VKILQAAGVETFESCEGGPGHAYTEATIKFSGSKVSAGWHALGVCLDHGLPVRRLSRTWDILDVHIPTGPYWEIVFSYSGESGNENAPVSPHCLGVQFRGDRSPGHPRQRAVCR